MMWACSPDNSSDNPSKEENIPSGGGQESSDGWKGVDSRILDVINISYPGLESAKAKFEANDGYAGVQALMAYYKSRSITNPSVNLSDKKLTSAAKSIADQAVNHRFYTKSYSEGTGADGLPLYYSMNNESGGINWTAAPSGVLDSGEFIKQIHRLMWMPYQAKAYNATGDEKYVKSIIEVYDDYIKQYPVPGGKGSGTAWTGLQVSQRLIGWLDVLPLILSSPSVTPEWFAKMMIYTYDAIECMRRTWYSPVTSNIYFTQVQALVENAIFFPEFTKSDEWLNESTSLVNSQFAAQFNEDGVHNELDASYHLGIVANFEAIHAFAQANGKLSSFPSDYTERLQKSCRFVMDIMYPDYSFESFNDTRSARQTKNVLLRNLQSYHDMFPSDAELQWMASEAANGQQPTSLVQKYTSSGYYVMRSGWTKDASMLILKNNYNPSNVWHCQPDNGTVALYHNGRKFLPDAGVYTYTTGATRDSFASTAMHNTLTLAGASISAGHMLGEFIKHESISDYELIETSNPSYDNLTHFRSVYMVDKKFYVIVDKAVGKAAGSVEVRFHLCADCSGSLGAGASIVDDLSADKQAGAHTIFVDGNNMVFRTFSDTENGYSALSGTSESSDEIDVKYTRKYYGMAVDKVTDKPVRFITVICPCTGDSSIEALGIKASFMGDGDSIAVTVSGETYHLPYSK